MKLASLLGRKRLTAVALASTLTAAAGEGFIDPGTGVLFPQRLGKLELTDVREFGDARLGRALTYHGDDLSADVFVYNRGLERIVAGKESAATVDEFEAAKRDIQEIDAWGRIEHLGDGAVETRSGDRSIFLRRAGFRFERSGATRWSYLYVLVESDHFVKLRVTCDLARSTCDQRTERFVDDLVGRFSHPSREPLPRDKVHRMVEELIENPYGEMSGGLRAILYRYVDGIRPEFVLCVSQFAPLIDSGNDDHTAVWMQIAISSGDFLLRHPDAIDDAPAYQLAGLEGALRIYENMLAANPAVRNGFLDGLVALRAEGRLAEHVRGHACDG